MQVFRRLFLTSLLMLSSATLIAQKPAKPASRLRFEVSFPQQASDTPLDGRVYVMLSTDPAEEPRFQISDAPDTQQFFGVDVDGLAAGKAAMIDATTIGYPADSLAAIPPGDYYVQGLLNIYKTFHLANGHTVKLPPERGEGQRWNKKPGNLYSKPVKVHVDPAQGGVIRIALTETIPADRGAEGHQVHQAREDQE